MKLARVSEAGSSRDCGNRELIKPKGGSIFRDKIV